MQSNLSTSSFDENLREKILARLQAEQQTAGAHLRVGILNGIVHLAGHTNTLAEREAAETLAREVRGVRGVVNRIEAPGAPSPARLIDLQLTDPIQSISQEE